MNARSGADDNVPRDLAEFEAELRRVLEQRLVAAAQSPRQPTDDEAAQLARMTAHMAMSDVARRTRPLRPVPVDRGAARMSSTFAERHGALAHVARTKDTQDNGEPPSASQGASATAQGSRRHTLLVTSSTLAAVALGVLLVRGVARDAAPGTPPDVDVTSRVPDTRGAAPGDDVYLGDDTGAGGASIVFNGRVTWDMRGQDGVVRVAVFNRDGDPYQAVYEHDVQGSEWTPTGPLPKRFRVVVDRPADDGVSREELLCVDYFRP